MTKEELIIQYEKEIDSLKGLKTSKKTKLLEQKKNLKQEAHDYCTKIFTPGPKDKKVLKYFELEFIKNKKQWIDKTLTDLKFSRTDIDTKIKTLLAAIDFLKNGIQSDFPWDDFGIKEEPIFENIKEYVAHKKIELHETAKNMNLSVAIVQVGHVPASDRYVKNKIKDCEEVGIPCKLVALPETITEAKLLKVINKLNKDKKVKGFIVQLPLPKGISEEKVKLAIDPSKDVDGFHPLNNKVAAATPAGIMMYLEDQKFDFDGKNAVIIGRSNIVGKPMHQLLLKKNMNVIMLHTHTSEEDKEYYLSHADLIVVASGHINTLTKDYSLKRSAVVMDVGINVKEDGKLTGDCEKDLRVSFQSPVPGGCGLLTRLALIKNLIDLYK